MSIASKVREKIIRTTQSKAFARAQAKDALRMLHEIAFEAAINVSENEYGYGPARVYTFADESTLTDDGRGYTVASAQR